MKHNYHRVDGLSECDYRDQLENLKYMRDMYCWNGKGNLKRLLMSLLYYRELPRKTDLVIQLFANFLSPHGMELGLFERLKKFNFDFETRILGLLRHSDPVRKRRSSPANRWRTNKAHYAKLMDDLACDVAVDMLGDDGEMMERVSVNRKRWASKDMPSVHRFKTRCKTKRRIRHGKETL